MNRKNTVLALAAVISAFCSCKKTDSGFFLPSANSETSPTFSGSGLSIALDPTLGDRTVSSGSNQVKIGSYIVKNTGTEAIRLTSLAIGATGLTSATVRQLSAIAATINSTSVGAPIESLPSSFSSLIVINTMIAPSVTDTISLYADIGTGLLLSFRTNLLVGGMGSTSATTCFTYNGTSFSGQAVSVIPTITVALISDISSVGQYIATGTATMPVRETTQAGFHLTSPAAATVTQLTLTVTGSSTATSASITSSTGTITVPFVSGIATFTGLSIAVPAGSTGTDVFTSASYAPIGSAGVASGDSSQIKLSDLKFVCGSTEETSQNVAAPTMILVASDPIMSVETAVSTLTMGLEEAIRVNVTANEGGNIELLSVPLDFSAVNATFSSSANNLVVEDIDGNTVSTTNTALSGGHTIISFPSGYLLVAGQTQIFRIFIPVTAVTGIGSASSYLTTKLDSGNGLSWLDVSGGATVPQRGTAYLPNYPTNTSVIHN